MGWLFDNFLANMPEPNFLMSYAICAGVVLAAAYFFIAMQDVTGGRPPPAIQGAAVAPLPAGASRADEAQALAARVATLAKEKRLAPKWIGDLARYEAAFVEAAQRRFRMRVLWFRFPVNRIAMTLHGGGAVDDCAAKTTLGVWARRPGGRLFHRVWTLAR